MPTYNVTLYLTVVEEYVNIEADSEEEAYEEVRYNRIEPDDTDVTNEIREIKEQ